jgi:hypothetical protein
LNNAKLLNKQQNAPSTIHIFFTKPAERRLRRAHFRLFFGDAQSIALLRFIREALQFIREGLLFIGEPPGDSISAEMDSQSSKNG